MKNGFAWNTHPANRKKNFLPKNFLYSPPQKKQVYTRKTFSRPFERKIFFLRFTSFFKKKKKKLYKIFTIFTMKLKSLKKLNMCSRQIWKLKQIQ